MAQDSHPTLRNQKDLDLFLARLSSGSVILEFEPGQGLYTREFSEAGHEIITIEEDWGAYLYPESLLARQTFRKSFDEIIIPYRSISGIWIHNILSFLDRDVAASRLKIFYDWLIKGGLLSFSVLEGEGDRYISEQTVQGIKRRKEVFYLASEIQGLLDQLGFIVIDAWREQKLDRSILHILANRDLVA